MTSGRPNREYADDIREAARTLTRTTRLGRWLFNHSEILRGSAERQVGIIGEAAHEIKESLPPEFQAAEPDLCDTLDQAYSMRNKLAHAYEKTDPRLVWQAAKTSTPDLVARLDRHFPAARRQPAGPAESPQNQPPPNPGTPADAPLDLAADDLLGARRNQDRRLCGATTRTGGICSHPAPRFKQKCPAGHPRKPGRRA